VVVVSLLRQLGCNGTVSAWLNTTDMTAQAGADYVALSAAQVIWRHGDCTPQNVSILVLQVYLSF
jgi:hypothetical protein